jgi:hypothetical protein
MKIQFGVMSSKYEMEAQELNQDSKMAMALFIKANVPIAIYKPKSDTFSPLTFFESKPKVNDEKVRTYYKSIKKIQ